MRASQLSVINTQADISPYLNLWDFIESGHNVFSQQEAGSKAKVHFIKKLNSLRRLFEEMHQKIAAKHGKYSSQLVNPFSITEDLICLLEGFTITAINEKPRNEDLVEFAASYFEEIRNKRNLLAERGIGNFRTGLYLSKDWNGQV